MISSNQLYEVITTIVTNLFEREDKFISKRQTAMIARNAKEGGSLDGFRHMGLIYTELSGVARKRASLPRLNDSLMNEMDGLIQESKTLDLDKNRVRQALYLVLKDCKTLQDIRDTLPNSLTNFLPELAYFQRTRKEAFTLENDPRGLAQFTVLKEKIEFYTATQLLY